MSDKVFYEELGNAIVQQAAEDYTSAFMGREVGEKRPEDVMRECETFFHSDWYATLTNNAISGDWMIRNLKLREMEKTATAYRTIMDGMNNVTFKAVVSFPQGKGSKKKKPMMYTIEPRYAGEIMDVLRLQLKAICNEIRMLKAEEKAGEDPNDLHSEDHRGGETK